MANHVNRWSPDTCGCVFEYEWDDSVPADLRVHSLKNTVKICPSHLLIASIPLDHWSAVSGENVRKNRVYGQFLGIAAITQTVLQDDGSSVVKLKSGVEFVYSWSGTDGSRVLNVSVSGASLTNQQKSSIQAWCDSIIGAGKVVVQ